MNWYFVPISIIIYIFTVKNAIHPLPDFIQVIIIYVITLFLHVVVGVYSVWLDCIKQHK